MAVSKAAGGIVVWEWLGTQAQTASPFVAVFCLLMLAICGGVIGKLWKQHVADHETLLTVSQSAIQANTAVALAIERSTSTTIVAIERLGAQLGNGRRR